IATPPPNSAAPVAPERHAPVPAASAPLPVAAVPVSAVPIASSAPATRVAEPTMPLPSGSPLAKDKSPEAATPARDITELLRDFDLPPVEEEEPVVTVKEAKPAPARIARAPWLRIALVAIAVVAVGYGGFLAWRAYSKPAAPALGSLSVQTNPPGVAVFVDGVAHGNTPARVSLTAGSHILELRGRGVPRVIP